MEYRVIKTHCGTVMANALRWTDAVLGATLFDDRRVDIVDPNQAHSKVRLLRRGHVVALKGS